MKKSVKRKLVKLLLFALAVATLSSALVACDSSEEKPEPSSAEVSAPQSSAEASTEPFEEPSEEPSEESSDVTEPIVRTWPHIQGSFIQYGPFVGYSERQLTKHFDYLSEAGIEILVLFTSANIGKDGKYNNLAYPSEYCQANKSADCDESHTDITERMLAQCQSHGIKAYLIPVNLDGWGTTFNPNDEIVRKEFVDNTLGVSRELYDLYKEKYPDAFYGWYFAPEFNNYFQFWDSTLYTNASTVLNSILEGYTELDPTMPFLMSPWFSDAAPYENAVNTAACWDRIFSGINFRKGDIFCPQDCVGSGLAHIDTFEEYYSEMKKVTDKYENLDFWGNPEDFVQMNWSSAPITRYVLQLEKARQYVGGFISFAYSHYYAPDVCGTKTFHEDYVKYYNTGTVDYYGESEMPVAGELTAETVSTGVKLSVGFGNCKYGISYVEFYRDGSLVGTAITPESDYAKSELTYQLTDKTVNADGKYAYSAKAYSFDRKTAATAELNIDVKAPKNVSFKKPYVTDYNGNKTYPDNGRKMTDGKIASTDAYSDADAAGYADCTSVKFTIDLQAEHELSSVVARALNSGSGGAIVSSIVQVSFSSDGETFTAPVKADGPSAPVENGWSVVEFKLTDVKARYVRIEYSSLRNWLFIDELAVYAKE